MKGGTFFNIVTCCQRAENSLSLWERARVRGLCLGGVRFCPHPNLLPGGEGTQEGHLTLYKVEVRVCLRIVSMGDSSSQKATHSDVDHGFGNIDSLLVVSHQAPPAGQPAEEPAPYLIRGALHHPATWQDMKARLATHAAHDLDDEIEEGRPCPSVVSCRRRHRRKLLDPPAPAHGIENHLCASAVGDVGGASVHW